MTARRVREGRGGMLPKNWQRWGRFRQRYWLWRNDCGYSWWRALWWSL